MVQRPSPLSERNGRLRKSHENNSTNQICNLDSPDPNDAMFYFDKNLHVVINRSRKSGINLHDQRQNNKTLMVFGDICQLNTQNMRNSN